MIEVSCAIIEKEGKILVTQRLWDKAEGGLWEFPGGKIEPGESSQICIIREIAEELQLQIEPLEELQPNVYAYPEKTVRLWPFRCRIRGGSLQLKDHQQYLWLAPSQLAKLAWCPADVPVVEQYLQLLQSR